MKPRILTNRGAAEYAASICRRRGIEMKMTEILRIVTAKSENGRPKYFWSKDIMRPKGGKGFILFDKGDFEERFIAALRHYEANKPLMFRGVEIKEEELLDPGFDWGQLDEEEE